MNATPLPTPLSGPSAAPAQTARPRAGETGDANQFKQHLAREVDQRQGAATAPATPAGAAKSTTKQQPQTLDKAGAPIATSVPAMFCGLTDGKAATDTGEASKIVDPGVGSEEEPTAPSNPMADLINLVASFNQPAALAARPTPASSAESAGIESTDGALSPGARPAQASLLAPALAGITDTNQAQAADAAISTAPARTDGGGEATEAIPADWSKILGRVQDGAAQRPATSARPSQGERSTQPPVQISAARMPEGLPPGIPVALAARPGERVAGPLPDRTPAARSERALTPQVDGTSSPRPERPLPAGAATAQAAAPSAAQTAAAADMHLARTDSAALAARPGGSVPDATAITDSAPAAPMAGPLPQSALSAANPAAALVAAENIPARVGTPAWDNQVAQKVVWMVAGEEQSATMTLNPPDMGPMQIVLSVTNDQASVTFSSATPEVRQALEDALPKLREMMSESGVSLGEATVNDGREEQRQAQESAPRQRNGNGNGNSAGSGRDSDEPARPPRRSGPEGLVDTFA